MRFLLPKRDTVSLRELIQFPDFNTQPKYDKFLHWMFPSIANTVNLISLKCLHTFCFSFKSEPQLYDEKLRETIIQMNCKFSKNWGFHWKKSNKRFNKVIWFLRKYKFYNSLIQTNHFKINKRMEKEITFSLNETRLNVDVQPKGSKPITMTKARRWVEVRLAQMNPLLKLVG